MPNEGRGPKVWQHAPNQKDLSFRRLVHETTLTDRRPERRGPVPFRPLVDAPPKGTWTGPYALIRIGPDPFNSPSAGQ